MRKYKRLREQGASYFFTLVTHERRKLFLEAETVELLSSSIATVQERHPFELAALVVLPAHLHALWQLPSHDADYPTRWRLIKERFTKAWVKRHGPTNPNASRLAKGEQALWQRRYWEHLIRDDEDLGPHLDYIHLNPVHHGLADAPKNWPHSSFAAWVAEGVYEAGWGSDEKPQLPEWDRSFE